MTLIPHQTYSKKEKNESKEAYACETIKRESAHSIDS